MEQKVKFLFYIKIYTFILLLWICHFNNDMSTFNKSSEENYIHCKKLDTISYRLLAKYKQDNVSYVSELKQKTPYNRVNEECDITNNEKGNTGKNKQSNECSSKNPRGQKQDKKNKNCTYTTKKYSNNEKKVFKELDYINFLKNNRTISNKLYKKVIGKKYGLRIATLVLLFFLFLILFIVDYSLGISIKKCLLISLVNSVPTDVFKSNWFTKIFEMVKEKEWFWKIPFSEAGDILDETMKQKSLLGSLFGIPIYCLPFLILGVIVIFVFFYYHKIVKKYKKINYRKR
ncbi:hypothetical protein MKS88_000619 [Plasmodium brasilianum]|uniref:Uncharacterized protein n=1 Tax=Plasmodium brasilianum TaxID=5824 RepID=A0ACB9YFT4_PLABR|nr:hypothetical protein MKS88_000619 [Plasmodium brasilianum]